MSKMVSTCSMSTGHSSTHAPHVTQDHNTSGSITSGTKGVSHGGYASDEELAPEEPLGPLPDPASDRSPGPAANSWSRSPMMSSFGESGLSVIQAGHWS